MSIEIKDLMANPETIPFSRLKYLARQPEEDVTGFFNELFNLSVLAKENNDWAPEEAFLDRWEDTLTQRLRAPIAYDTTPWTPFTKPLNKARIAALSTGGIYVEGQPPFNTDGDWSYREIHLDTPLDQKRIVRCYPTRRLSNRGAGFSFAVRRHPINPDCLPKRPCRCLPRFGNPSAPRNRVRAESR